MPELRLQRILIEPRGSLVTCVADSELGLLTCRKMGTKSTMTQWDRKG